MMTGCIIEMWPKKFWCTYFDPIKDPACSSQNGSTSLTFLCSGYSMGAYLELSPFPVIVTTLRVPCPMPPPQKIRAYEGLKASLPLNNPLIRPYGGIRGGTLRFSYGQILIFHQPKFPWNSRGFPLQSPPIGGNRSWKSVAMKFDQIFIKSEASRAT